MSTKLENLSAAAWLAVLMQARQNGETMIEVRARQELERIGINVSLREEVGGREGVAGDIAQAPAPLLINAAAAAAMCSVSRATWFSWQACGMIPAAVLRRGQVVRWSAQEVADWCKAGCPSHDRWLVIRGAKR